MSTAALRGAKIRGFSCGGQDALRELHGDVKGQYTYWSTRGMAKEPNKVGTNDMQEKAPDRRQRHATDNMQQTTEHRQHATDRRRQAHGLACSSCVSATSSAVLHVGYAYSLCMLAALH